MTEPRWIEKEALLHLHNASLSRFGGVEGINDGLLESALARPRNAFHYGNTRDVAALAASYAFGLIKDRPFLDGNKRAAFLACGLFLDLNGARLTATPADAVSAISALADGTIDEAKFAAWVGANLK